MGILSKRISVQLDPKLADKIKALARKERTTAPAIIRRIVGIHFDKGK